MSASLHASKNYKLFRYCHFNREVQKIRDLERSMRAHGFIPAYPLHVCRGDDGKLEIKAGHHRFEVAMRLGLQVYYVICADDATVLELEKSTVPWKLRDYLTSYCRLGSEPHKAIMKYAHDTGINVSQAASLLAGDSGSSGHQGTKIKDGTYALGPSEHANAMAEIVRGCREVGLEFAANRNFVSALSLALRVDGFEPKTFLHRLALNIGMARKQATVVQFLDMIEQIYNRQSKQKIALAFLAKEAARERAAVKKIVVEEK